MSGAHRVYVLGRGPYTYRNKGQHSQEFQAMCTIWEEALLNREGTGKQQREAAPSNGGARRCMNSMWTAKGRRGHDGWLPVLSKVCHKTFHSSPPQTRGLSLQNGCSKYTSPASYVCPLSEAAAVPTACSRSCPQVYTDTHLSEYTIGCQHASPARLSSVTCVQSHTFLEGRPPYPVFTLTLPGEAAWQLG